MQERGGIYTNRDLDLDDVDPRGRARRAAAHDSRRRGRRRSRGRRVLRYTAFTMAVLLLAAVGTGAYIYVHFDRNIKSSSLLPPEVTQSPEIADQFGRTAMNILLLGNSGRIDAADCKLAGACDDTVTTADTIMVVHLSADRSNMTVMSIPRDSIVPLPSCAHESVGLVNGALSGGPACAVEAVNRITGLTIDHFIEIDMAGVVTMSNALGGVPVCVTNNIYDSYSHLKLRKGRSVIQGTQALAWLRTRHAFTNEVYREEAQHMFMAALFRKLEANASLTHISTLYSIADAATKSLTVDSALGSVTSLLSLAQELGKVPSSRITMLSVPTIDYSGPNATWRQQLQFDPTAAEAMFAAIKSDTPYTAGKTSAGGSAGSGSSSGVAASPSTSAPNAANVVTSSVHAEVQNGSGTNGRAGEIKQALVSDGFSSGNLTTDTAAIRSTTALYYPSTRADSAAAVAAALGLPGSAMHESGNYSQVTVVIGQDWTAGTTYGATPSGTTAVSVPTGVASSAPSSSLQTNAGDTKACMYVAQPEW